MRLLYGYSAVFALLDVVAATSLDQRDPGVICPAGYSTVPASHYVNVVVYPVLIDMVLSQDTVLDINGLLLNVTGAPTHLSTLVTATSTTTISNEYTTATASPSIGGSSGLRLGLPGAAAGGGPTGHIVTELPTITTSVAASLSASIATATTTTTTIPMLLSMFGPGLQKRQNVETPSYVGTDGSIVKNCSQAIQLVFANGHLFIGNKQFSTDPGVSSQAFAPASSLGNITSTFSETPFSWDHTAFANGTAIFCVKNNTLNVQFTAPVPDDCIVQAVSVMPASACLNGETLFSSSAPAPSPISDLPLFGSGSSGDHWSIPSLSQGPKTANTSEIAATTLSSGASSSQPSTFASTWFNSISLTASYTNSPGITLSPITARTSSSLSRTDIPTSTSTTEITSSSTIFPFTSTSTMLPTSNDPSSISSFSSSSSFLFSSASASFSSIMASSTSSSITSSSALPTCTVSSAQLTKEANAVTYFIGKTPELLLSEIGVWQLQQSTLWDDTSSTPKAMLKTAGAGINDAKICGLGITIPSLILSCDQITPVPFVACILSANSITQPGISAVSNEIAVLLSDANALFNGVGQGYAGWDLVDLAGGFYPYGPVIQRDLVVLYSLLGYQANGQTPLSTSTSLPSPAST